MVHMIVFLFKTTQSLRSKLFLINMIKMKYSYNFIITNALIDPKLHFSALLKNRLTRLCFTQHQSTSFLVDLLVWCLFPLFLFLWHLALELFVVESHSPAAENRPCLKTCLLGHLHQLEMKYKLTRMLN